MNNINNNLLRPIDFNSFCGQNDIVEQLKIHIFSSKKEKKVLDHVLFYGPPGLGKTTLSRIIANEFKSNFVSITAVSIDKPSTIISILSQIKNNDILFIDEIHRLKKEYFEILYSVMEDFKINISYESNEETKILALNIPPFTLIGATTNAGVLPFALRDRFPLIYKLNYYSSKELVDIYKDKIFNLNIDENLYVDIVSRSRSTPRCLINIMKKLYDYKIFYKIRKFNKEELYNAFKKLKINDFGLNDEDIEIIKLMFEKYENNPISIETIATSLNEEISNIKNINEPFLVMNDIIIRTRRGRILSKKGVDIYQNYIVR